MSTSADREGWRTKVLRHVEEARIWALAVIYARECQASDQAPELPPEGSAEALQKVLGRPPTAADRAEFESYWREEMTQRSPR